MDKNRYLLVFFAGVIATESFETRSIFSNVGPVETLILPVIIERHSVSQIMSPDGRMPSVQVNLADVVTVGEQYRRCDTYDS